MQDSAVVLSELEKTLDLPRLYPTVIGVAGYKRSGKDTFTRLATEALSGRGMYVKSLAFGDLIRHEIAQALHDAQPDIPQEHFTRMMEDDATKEQFRVIMQWWGDFRRTFCGYDYWIQQMRRRIRLAVENVVIVSDLRLPAELDMIKEFGGVACWIDREGCAAGEHATEHSLTAKCCDITLNNPGEVEPFRDIILDTLFCS